MSANYTQKQSSLYLDPAFIFRSSLKVSLSDTLGNNTPQPPTLPLILFLDRCDGNFFFRSRYVVERDTPAGVLRSGVPRSFDHMRILANTRRRRYSRLERVRLAREITFALVFDLSKISDMISFIFGLHIPGRASQSNSGYGLSQ